MRVWAKGGQSLQPESPLEGSAKKPPAFGQRPEAGGRERWCSLGGWLAGQAVAGRERFACSCCWLVGREAAQPALSPDSAPLRSALQVKRYSLGRQRMKVSLWRQQGGLGRLKGSAGRPQGVSRAGGQWEGRPEGFPRPLPSWFRDVEARRADERVGRGRAVSPA
ncbi:MAG: hypothetical protein QXQ53_06860 [Candidatus Methanosuratincola sp.]